MGELEDDYDGLSFKHLVSYARSSWNYLLRRSAIWIAGGLLGAVLGFTYSRIKKPVYTAECTFVLEDERAGSQGQFAGLASVIGVDLGGSGSPGLFRSDNILELYRSRTMLKETLLSKGEFGGAGGLIVDRFVAINKLRDDWADVPKLAKFQFKAGPRPDSLLQDSLLHGIIEDIREDYMDVGKLDKKSNIISVKISSKDELFAKRFADRLVATVNNFYINYRTRKSSENYIVLQKQADSIQKQLNSSIKSTAASIDATPNPNPAARQTLKAPSQRKQLGVDVTSGIYAEVSKNLFLTNLTRLQEKPLIQVIDIPELPLQKTRFGAIKGLVFGMFFGGFLSLLLVGIRDFFKQFS